jgi:hypothetical protein
MPITYTGEAIQRIAQSVYNGVYNPKAPIKIDRRKMPWRSFLDKHITTAPLAGDGSGVILKYKLTDTGGLQFWERKEQLGFSEQDFLVDGRFPWSNLHYGIELVHDDIEAMGYVVLPNQARGKNFAKADPDSEPFRIINYVTEAVEAMMDKYDIEEDKTFLLDNSADPKAPQGLDAYMPIATTNGMDTTTYAGQSFGYYSAGSVGGRARSAFPDFMHWCWIGATFGAGGTLRTALTRSRREAEIRSRGRTTKGIAFMMCGSYFMDKYVQFATANNTNYTTAVTVLNQGGSSKLDIGIPDTGIMFEGVPVVHNPTFEILDALNPGLAVPWTKRCYLIDESSMELAYAPGKQKYFSAPWDEGDVRVTRLSLDSKAVLLPKVLNANAVVSVA